VYVVHFTQLEAAQSAQDFTSLNVCTREEKAALSRELEGFKFSSPYGPEIRKWLKHGIGLHHAGLLPKYRVLAEQTRAERPAENHLRHGHARVGQCPDPDRYYLRAYASMTGRRPRS